MHDYRWLSPDDAQVYARNRRRLDLRTTRWPEDETRPRPRQAKRGER